MREPWVLNGDNFNDILSGTASAEGSELRLILDWDKLSYLINGTESVSFSESDVLSATVVNNNRLMIELTAAKAAEISSHSDEDYSNDQIDIVAGFIRDLAGNVASTDSLSGGSVAEADLETPDLTTAMAAGNELTLSFTESLDGLPANNEFTISVDGTVRTVNSVTIDNQDVVVAFDGSELTGNEQLFFSYSGSNIQDDAGNSINTISDQVAGFSHSTAQGLEQLIGDIGDGCSLRLIDMKELLNTVLSNQLSCKNRDKHCFSHDCCNSFPYRENLHSTNRSAC